MIKGVGIDVIEKKRVSNLHQKYGKKFENRVLGDLEKKALSRKSNKSKSRFIANNFACKEAFSKVIGLGFSEGISLKEIEVLRNSKGKPYLVLDGKTNEIAKKIGIKNFHVSISDTETISTAFVVGE